MSASNGEQGGFCPGEFCPGGLCPGGLCPGFVACGAAETSLDGCSNSIEVTGAILVSHWGLASNSVCHSLRCSGTVRK